MRTIPSLQCLCIRKMGETFEWQPHFLQLKVWHVLEGAVKTFGLTGVCLVFLRRTLCLPETALALTEEMCASRLFRALWLIKFSSRCWRVGVFFHAILCSSVTL